MKERSWDEVERVLELYREMAKVIDVVWK